MLSGAINVNRKQLYSSDNKRPVISRHRLPLVRQTVKDKVVKFLERDDVSTCLPGKADTVTTGKQKHQKRIFNDYLHNIYTRFQVEHGNTRIVLSTFCKMCPAYIRPVFFQ